MALPWSPYSVNNKSNMKDLKIFLVDDDVFTLAKNQKYLLNAGYKDITIFTNGTHFLNQLSNNPDVVFLDHTLDDISGFELLKKIKRFNPDIHTVMLSGQSDIKTAIDSLKFGAFDYIIKGFDEGEKMTGALIRINELNRFLNKGKPRNWKRFLAPGINR